MSSLEPYYAAGVLDIINVNVGWSLFIAACAHLYFTSLFILFIALVFVIL